MDNDLPTLIIFAKAPRIGSVKTRLAADIGDVGAWRVYRSLLRRVLRRLAGDRRWRTILAVTPDKFAARGSFGPDISHNVSREVSVLAQGSGDLGARMGRAFRTGGGGPKIIVGCDVPGITASNVAQAFDALESHDVVLGPAVDGGYWLVGVRDASRVPHLFRDVRWSGPHALADTQANIPGHLRLALLGTLADIDRVEDLTRLAPDSLWAG